MYKKFSEYKKDFYWLMENLLPPTENIKGCELIFPDTAFFNSQGNCQAIIKMDKDYCLKSIKVASKLLVTNVQKDFSDRI